MQRHFSKQISNTFQTQQKFQGTNRQQQHRVQQREKRHQLNEKW